MAKRGTQTKLKAPYLKRLWLDTSKYAQPGEGRRHRALPLMRELCSDPSAFVEFNIDEDL